MQSIMFSPLKCAWVCCYLACLLCLLSRLQLLQAKCNADDRSSLLQFKDGLEINKHANCHKHNCFPKVAWWNKNSSDCCLWYGVECDEKTGHVTGVDLSESCLYGSLNSSSTLFRLSHLRSLNLAYNNFTGSPIPVELTRLSNLTALNLSCSEFSDRIPSQISTLSNLSSLDLSFLKLMSAVPPSLANLTSLRILSLQSSGLHGLFPVGIFQLPYLQILDVSINPHLNGHLPDFHSNSSLKSLRLQNTNFSGGLPPTIANLGSLEELDLRACFFSGQVPSSVGNLTQLTYLGLSNNQLTGEVPPSLANLNQLSYIDMGNNHLTGHIPSELFSLRHLIHLDLSKNQLTGGIPHPHRNCSTVTYLNFSLNKLQGLIPSSLFELVNLQFLDLSSNNLSGTVRLDEISKLQRLTSLYLCFNQLSVHTEISANATVPKLKALGLNSCNLNEVPHFLRCQNQSHFIDLSNNYIHGQIPEWLWSTSRDNLKFMNLSHNLFTSFEQQLVALQQSRILVLDFSHNSLQGSIPPLPPTSITYFSASHNKLTGQISDAICTLSSLKVLDLANNSMNGMLPQCLGSFSASLEVLNLGSNNFHGRIPQTWRYMSELKMLDLSYNKLIGKVPRSLSNCKKLEVLDFRSNHINDIFPTWLGSLPELQILILGLNEFHGVIKNPKGDSEFPKLRIIDLSHNNFTGNLPFKYFQQWNAMKIVEEGRVYMHMGWIIKLMLSDDNRCSVNYYYSMTLIAKCISREYPKIIEGLKSIDLSGNSFGGEIPASIGNLKGLRLLNLSNNNLVDQIPSLLGNLTVLESLDLSHNKLSGQIPQALTHITTLGTFIVSHNNLARVIPQGPQFSTFDINSYEGNPGLCGKPLNDDCADSKASPIPPPPSTLDEDDSISLFEFEWMVVSMGYGSGLIVGLVISHNVSRRIHDWLVKTFGSGQ